MVLLKNVRFSSCFCLNEESFPNLLKNDLIKTLRNILIIL